MTQSIRITYDDSDVETYLDSMIGAALAAAEDEIKQSMELLRKQAQTLAPTNGEQPLLHSWTDVKAGDSGVVGEVYFAAVGNEDEKSVLYLHEVGRELETTPHLKFLERPFQENYENYVSNLVKEIGKEWR